MELDEETLQGRWSIDKNTGMEFFIINDGKSLTLIDKSDILIMYI